MRVVFVWAACLCTLAAEASPTYSYTGSLPTPEDTFEQHFSLSTESNVEMVTWGFGGGTNGAGASILAGGFDPLVALFTSTGSIVTDSLGNPVAGADTLSNFVGNCPPAATVTIGTGTGSSVCGDVFLEADNLAAGNYLLLLTDANNFPDAVNPGPPLSSLLSDGFMDFTGGVFQTCNTTSEGTFCITRTGTYAVDLIEQPAPSGVPEPGTWALIAAGMASIATFRYQKRRRSK